MERISRERFIRVGAALGVSAASASVLAACGGGDTGSSSGGSTSGGSTDSSGGSSGGASTVEQTTGGSGETTQAQSGASSSGAIASESEVAPGSAKKFKDSGKDAVLVHLDSGDFVAYSAVCTHQGCTVAYKNGQLACPCHGSVFDPTNGGAVVNGPAQQPLPEIPVEVKDGNVVKA